jgi:hypothetical protein
MLNNEISSPNAATTWQSLFVMSKQGIAESQFFGTSLVIRMSLFGFQFSGTKRVVAF